RLAQVHGAFQGYRPLEAPARPLEAHVVLPGPRPPRAALAADHDLALAADDLHGFRCEPRHLRDHDETPAALVDVDARAPLTLTGAVRAVEQGQPLEELVHLPLEKGDGGQRGTRRLPGHAAE